MTIQQKATEVAREANNGNIEPITKFCNVLFDKMNKTWLDVEVLLHHVGLKDKGLVYSIWEQGE